MHPILGHGSRLLIYLASWLPLGATMAGIVVTVGGVPWREALALALPLAMIDAFVCLAAWYPARSIPPQRSSLGRAVGTHVVGAALSSAVWLLVGQLWALGLARVPAFPEAAATFRAQVPVFFPAGVLLYLLAAAASHLHLAVDASREAEQRAFEARKEQELAARELDLARALQRRLLPPAEHDGSAFRLAARNLAARFVAGDFYDYFRLRDGSVRLAVADVAGKGMAASLIMATVKAVLPLVAAERSLVATVDELNRKLAAELAEREFVALCLAGYDPASGRLEIVNAGLPDPYLLRDGRATALDAPTPRLPLGLRAESGYRSLEVSLQAGDRVLFLTDGLPEAPIGPDEPLGYDALLGFLDHGEAVPGRWLDRLLERVRDATADELEDDWTVLMLERR